MKTHFTSISSMSDFLGKQIGLSEWFTVSQKMVNDFARVTHDEQWIHIDQERAKVESPYGTTIAHGYLITSLIPKFLGETLSFNKMKMGINYGSDRVRFINAVPVGAEIRASIVLQEVKIIEGGCRYTTKVTIDIKDQEKPACVAEIIALVLE